MRAIVEVMETERSEAGRPTAVGWRTDSYGSRYWAGRRFAELTGRGQVARLVDARGDLVKFGA